MALKTISKFYYGLKFDEFNNNLEFSEGLDTFVAEITPGDYTFAGLVIEIARVMTARGNNEYSVSFDRTTRALTISADGEFALLTATGESYEASAFPLLGFDVGEDYIGLSEYISEGCGLEYLVQFPIQSFIGTEHFQKARDASVKRSTTGVTEAIIYGLDKRMETDLLFITDVLQPTGGVVRNNPRGVQDCLDFLNYAITKAPVELMRDESKPEEFEIFILESTEADQNGLGFRLIEEYDKGLPEYFKTGKLTWLLQES